MNFWRKEGKAILVGGGFLGLVVVGLAFLAASFLADLATKIPPTARPALHPARMGLFCEDVELRAKDGKKISGWWMPGGQKGNPPVIVLHGLGAGKAHMIDYILFAQAAGYPVLAIDFRGHGMSETSLTSIGYYESWDVEAAIEFVRKRGAGDPVLWGTSMGAVAALLAAAEDGSVAGVIADAPFDTYRNTIRHHAKLMYGMSEFPLLTLAMPMIEERAKFKLDAVDSLGAVKRIDVPILILAAEEDQRMDPAMVRTIYEVAAGPKEFWIIPGEGHESRSFSKEYRERIRTFLGKLRVKPTS